MQNAEIGIIGSEAQGTCQWCGKTKKVVTARLDNGAIVNFCWKDMEKTVDVRMLTNKGGQNASGKASS